VRNRLIRFGFFLIALCIMIGGESWPVKAESFSSEPARNGQWVSVDGASVWGPYVTAGWWPYFNGYWGWYNSFGWTWVSSDPFGYVTYHCGGWIYTPVYDWCWIPGYIWRPAYVSWVAVGPYYGWMPSVRRVDGSKFSVKGFTAQVHRPIPAEIPRFARPLAVETHQEGVRRPRFSRQTGGEVDRTQSVESHRDFPKMGGYEWPIQNIQKRPTPVANQTFLNRTRMARPKPMIDRGPAVVQELISSPMGRGMEIRLHPSSGHNATVRYPRIPPNTSNPSGSSR